MRGTNEAHKKKEEKKNTRSLDVSINTAAIPVAA